MRTLGSIPYLRPCREADDAFVYDVFCTTWEHEVAALPNQKLAQHVLRIQHIAQERRFENTYPSFQRYVVMEADEPAGRLYVYETGSGLQIIDLTLMPEYRNRGIGTRILKDLLAYATQEGQTVGLRVERRNEGATMLAISLGFRLVGFDDVENVFEWTPAPVSEQHLTAQVGQGPRLPGTRRG